MKLPRVLADTMTAVQAALKTSGIGVRQSDVHHHLSDVNIPALRERLRTLCKLGVLKSDKNGPVTFYTITSKK